MAVLSGLMKAILDAIQGQDELIAGQRITQLTAPLFAADTEINVVSTIGFGEFRDGWGDAKIIIGPSQRELLNSGVVGTVDGLIETADPLLMEDRIIFKGKTYVVTNNPIEARGRDGYFWSRRAGLRRLEF